VNQDAKQPPAAVDGIIPAAGRSSRMGASKPTLDAAGAPFIERAVVALLDGGCRDVIAVLSPDDATAATAAARAGARVLMNTVPDSEQIDSIRLALRNLLPGATGAVVLPVDHPLATSGTVRTLIDAWAARRAPIARASHQGSAGHPTLFSAAVFDELLRGELPEGARTIVANHAADLLDVPVDDPGVTTDVDTPEDYRRAFGTP
jgi:molybdenum cofactor cytidylyltransferase